MDQNSRAQSFHIVLCNELCTSLHITYSRSYTFHERCKKSHLQVPAIFSKTVNFITPPFSKLVDSCSIIYITQTSFLSLSYLHILDSLLPIFQDPGAIICFIFHLFITKIYLIISVTVVLILRFRVFYPMKANFRLLLNFYEGFGYFVLTRVAYVHV
jgi:hypothetical protein